MTTTDDRPQLDGEAYMALLLERQAAYVAEHPPTRPWLMPLLEWFIEPGDERLFTPPTAPVVETAGPTPRPRVYRTAASLREKRDRLLVERARYVEPLMPEVAAARGVALGRRRTMRNAEREDRRLAAFVRLDRRIAALDVRIRAAEARERKAADQ